MHHRKNMKNARVTHLPPPQALNNWRYPLMRALLCLGVSTAALPTWAEDLLNLPLEDLLKIEIRSASRKVQQVQDVAAAVFVISRDDILRSGVRTIPEALRMAPGVEVARIANNRWAVSIRGFNGRFANKLLVLKDGRSVYSPLFSGVLWEAEDTVLSDIERIEVIRGPGAAMWGANAVNGVINIISRPAGETLGTTLMAATGTDERGAVALSHGLAVGDGHVRLTFKGLDRDPSRATSGEKGNDGWTAARLGLRGDWPAQGGGQWSLVSEAYQSRADERRDLSRFSSAPPTFDARQANSGGHLSLHREQPMSDGGQVDWQVSAEQSTLDSEALIREERQTISGEYQRRLPLGRHELILGASYRHSQDNIDVNNRYASQPDQRQRTWRIASIYAHDDYELIPQQLRLSGGIRVDHDNWSGAQVQPNVRLAWTPDSGTTWWSSLGRASRTPSRYELDIPYVISELAGFQTLRLLPANALKAEQVNTFELGYRKRISPQVSMDFAAFVSDYSDLASFRVLPMDPTQPAVLPVDSTNDTQARTRGFEWATDWQISPKWRLQPSYTRLQLRSPRTGDPIGETIQAWWEGRVAHHRVSLRSSWTLDNGHQLDLWLKHVSPMRLPQLPAYTVLDVRYAIKLGPHAELAVVGQNLLNQRHVEYQSDYLPTQPTEIGRSISIKGTWRF